MITKKYAPHIFAISALFTLGNAVILMHRFDLLCSAISLVLSLALIGLSSFLLKILKRNKLTIGFLLAIICIVAAYGAVTVLLDYIRFLRAEQMPQASVILLGVLLLAVIVFFSSSKKIAVYKYGLFVFVISILIIAVCFASGIKVFTRQNATLYLSEHSFSVKDFFRFFSPVIVLPFWFGEEKSQKPVYWGVATAVLLILVTALQTVLTIGQNSGVLYPYLKSIGVISSGSLFTRLDGLVWFLFFAVSIIKVTVCTKTIMEITTRK